MDFFKKLLDYIIWVFLLLVLAGILLPIISKTLNIDMAYVFIAMVVAIIAFLYFKIGTTKKDIVDTKKRENKTKNKVQKTIEEQPGTTKKMPGDVLIAYRDGDGNLTKRSIDIENVDDDGYVYAYCHLRNDERTFRIERIKELIDLKTGEVYSNPWKYFREYYKIAQPIEDDETKTIVITVTDMIENSAAYRKKREEGPINAKKYLKEHANAWYAQFDETLFFKDGKFKLPRYKSKKSDTILNIKIKDISDQRDFWSFIDKEERKKFGIEDFNREGDSYFEFEIEPYEPFESITEKFLIDYGIAETPKHAQALKDIVEAYIFMKEQRPVISSEREILESFDFIEDIERDEGNKAIIEDYASKYLKPELYELCKKHGVECKKSDRKNELIEKLLDAGILQKRDYFEVGIDYLELEKVLEKIGNAFLEEVKKIIASWHPYAKKEVLYELASNCEIEPIGKLLNAQKEEVERYCSALRGW